MLSQAPIRIVKMSCIRLTKWIGRFLSRRSLRKERFRPLMNEMGRAFSPDGTEFYFSKFVPYTTAPRLGANVCFALSCWAVEHA
jgi:hypothetical protein